MNVGDEIDVRIEAVGEKGDGIAKKKGFVLFVPNTQAGEEIRIRVTKVLRKVGFAEKIGEAQGPIEADERPPREEAPVSIEPQPAPEDTDDFGEEPEDEPEAEEPTEEEPSDEDLPEPPKDDEDKS